MSIIFRELTFTAQVATQDNWDLSDTQYLHDAILQAMEVLAGRLLVGKSDLDLKNKS